MEFVKKIFNTLLKKNERVIEGGIFIIPNSAATYKADKENYWNGWQEKAMSRFGYSLKDGEKMIEVWCYTPGNDESNWESHSWEFSKLTGVEGDTFPRYLPYKFLKDLKEGKSIKLRRKDGITFKLTARQRETRYRSWGNFQNVLDILVPRGWNTLCHV